MKHGKFNISWQIVRVQARRHKNVADKIDLILDYMNTSPSECKLKRVVNWLQMTSYAYADNATKDMFNSAISRVYAIELSGCSCVYDSMLDCVDIADIQAVMKDLSKRKYGFMMNRTPAAHISFVHMLENGANIRGHQPQLQL